MALKPITDVIMVVKEDEGDYMQQIIDGRNSFEFRQQQLSVTVKRIWFLQVPLSILQYVCEIAPARTRDEGDEPLPEGEGMFGNLEYNTRHPNWEGYDFAYEILAVYELRVKASLSDLERRFEIEMPFKHFMETPELLRREVDLSTQIKIR